MATRIELKDSGVVFNKEEHTYRIGDTFLSGITGMLQRQLFPNEFDGIPSAVLNAPLTMETESTSHAKISI